MTRRYRDPKSGLTYATFAKHITCPQIPWQSYAPNVIAMHDLIVAAGPVVDEVIIGRVLGRAVDRWEAVGGRTRLVDYAKDCVVLAVLAVRASRTENSLALTAMHLHHVDVADVTRVLESDNPALLWLLTGKMPKIGEALRALHYGALGNSYITKYLSHQGRPAPAQLRFDETRNKERKALLESHREAAKAEAKTKAKTKGAKP